MSTPHRLGHAATPRTALLAPALLVVLLTGLLAGCSGGGAPESDGDASPSPSETKPTEARVVAVGDIACAPGEPVTEKTCQHEATAALTTRLDPELVLVLGDLQYPAGELTNFQESYDESWGALSDRAAMVPGNHEYYTEGAEGFDEYTGATVPDVREAGGWRIYMIDSNCRSNGCPEQTAWLADQLAQDPPACTAIAMHHPRWSSGPHGSERYLQSLWKTAADNGVDLALTAHSHHYERFGRLDAKGKPDEEGVRQFVVGTGGKSFYGFPNETRGSEVQKYGRFGVLDLTLRPDGYDWEFVDIEDEVEDSGSEGCTP